MHRGFFLVSKFWLQIQFQLVRLDLNNLRKKKVKTKKKPTDESEILTNSILRSRTCPSNCGSPLDHISWLGRVQPVDNNWLAFTVIRVAAISRHGRNVHSVRDAHRFGTRFSNLDSKIGRPVWNKRKQKNEIKRMKEQIKLNKTKYKKMD